MQFIKNNKNNKGEILLLKLSIEPILNQIFV